MTKELKISVETITPQVAANWLEREFNRNRPFSEATAMQYAADIRAGRWRLSDQAISFNEQADLVNGRTRLEAVILADEPIVSLVIRNLPNESVFILDGGRRRTTDDAFHIAGYDYPRGFGSTVRRMILGARSSIGRKITDLEVKDFMDGYGDMIRFAHRVLSSGRFSSAIIRAVIARAAIKRHSRGELEKFCETLTTGMMVPGQEGAVVLRNYVLEQMELGGGSRGPKLYLMAETCLNSFFTGDKSRKLKASTEEMFPVPSLDLFPREIPKIAEETA